MHLCHVEVMSVQLLYGACFLISGLSHLQKLSSSKIKILCFLVFYINIMHFWVGISPGKPQLAIIKVNEFLCVLMVLPDSTMQFA